jgi:hypothetical protein
VLPVDRPTPPSNPAKAISKRSQTEDSKGSDTEVRRKGVTLALDKRAEKARKHSETLEM